MTARISIVPENRGLILGLETATPLGSLALIENEQIIIERYLLQKGNHAEELLPALDQMLKANGLNISQLEAIAVSKGPGSFTGLRIGVSFAKGLAFSLKIPLLGVPTLDALAWNLVDSDLDGLICPLLDARKKQVYAALYEHQGHNLKLITDYLAIDPLELLRLINQNVLSHKVIFLGDGLAIYGGMIKDFLGQRAIFAVEEQRLPHASKIAWLGLKRLRDGRIENLASFVPLYVRPSEVGGLRGQTTI